MWNSANEEAVKNVPKPVFNLVGLKVDSIVSNILSTPITLRFNCADDNEANNTNIFTKFGSFLLRQMKHERFKERNTKLASYKGTSFSHFVFNDKCIGEIGEFKGSVEEEIIPFDKLAVSNPKIKDIQKQKFIIIKSRKPYAVVCSLLDNPKNKDKITKDDTDNTEIKDSDLITVYLKYFRKDGEVYHQMSTDTIMVYKPRPLNPHLIKGNEVEKINCVSTPLEEIVKGNFKIDEEATAIQDTTLEKSSESEYQDKFYVYPVVPYLLKESEDYLYGMPIANDIINTNKCINQLYSSVITNAMYNSNDIMVVKKGALKGQVITSKAGQVIVDNTPTGDGIRRLGGMNVLSNGMVDLANAMINTTRVVSQFSETFTGDDSRDLSGVAIAQRQSQAEKPIDSMRKLLWHSEEDVGKVIEMYIKFYYSNITFYDELTEAEMIQQNTQSKYQKREINGEDYIGKPIFINVEAVQGTKDSDVMLMSFLQSLVYNGNWSQMAVEDKQLIIEMTPNLPKKETFKQMLKEQQTSENNMLKQQMQELMQQNNSLVNALQRANNGLDYMKKYNQSMEKQLKDSRVAYEQDLKARDNANNVLQQTQDVVNS